MKRRASYKNVVINQVRTDAGWTVITDVEGVKVCKEVKRFADEFDADLHYEERRSTLVDLAARDGDRIIENHFRNDELIEDGIIR